MHTLRTNPAAIDTSQAGTRRRIDLEPNLATGTANPRYPGLDMLAIKKAAIGNQTHRQLPGLTVGIKSPLNEFDGKIKFIGTGWLTVSGKRQIDQSSRALRHMLHHEIAVDGPAQKALKLILQQRKIDRRWPSPRAITRGS